MLLKFRLDRMLSLGIAYPASRLLNWQGRARVPILMYHSISDALGNKHPYFETNTAPLVFARQMQFLYEIGYRTIGLNEAVDAIQAGIPIEKKVVLTFDDGYKTFYSAAFPVLMQYGFRATVFVVTDLASESTVRPESKDYMSWGEIRHVHRNGISIGSHTVTHSALQKMGRVQVKYEIRASREIIEEKLGASPTSFSCPYAFPEADRRAVAVLREALENSGYHNGVSTIIGTAGPQHDTFFLPRLPVNSYDDLRLFRAKLAGGYDWLHTAQRLYKNLRRHGGPITALTQARSY